MLRPYDLRFQIIIATRNIHMKIFIGMERFDALKVDSRIVFIRGVKS
jgi:hypothetical protein